MIGKKMTLKQNIIWNSAGTTVFLLLQWVMTIVVVRISGYKDAGILSLCMSIGNVLTPMATYGIRQYQASDLTHRFPNGVYIVTRFFTSAVVLGLGFSFSLLSHYTTYQIVCINIYIILRIIESVLDVFHGIDQREHRMDIIGLSFLIRGVANFAVFSIVLLLTGLLSIAMTAMAVSTILCLIFFDLPKSRSIDSIEPEWNFRKTRLLLSDCTPLMISGLISSALAFYPRYLLEKYNGDQLLGIYSSVATPAIIIQVSSSFIFAPLVPVFARHYHAGEKRDLSRLMLRIFAYIMVIALIGVLVSIFGGKFILSMLFGSDIILYHYLLLPAVINSILTSIVWLLFSVLTAVRLLREQFLSSTIALIICLAISPMLIRIYNMNGVNFAFLITQGVQFILMCLFFYYNYYRRKTHDQECSF